MDNDALSECIGAIKSDIDWIKKSLQKADDKFAPKWVVIPVLGMTGMMLTWVLNQWLHMIPAASATILTYLK